MRKKLKLNKEARLRTDVNTKKVILVKNYLMNK